MQLPKALLGLPTSLLLLVAAQLQAQELQQQQLPTAIKKMSTDSGEKLLPEHYAFAPEAALLAAAAHPQPRSPTLTTPEEEEGGGLPPKSDNSNNNSTMPFLAPFAVHYNYPDYSESQQQQQQQRSWRRPREESGRDDDDRNNNIPPARYLRGSSSGGGGSSRSKRQFSCPPDTAACAGIGQPDYCCATGTVCFAVDGAPDSGNVGCCPEGRSCGGSVGRCAGDATACSADVGGGCCIAGYVCAEVGCIASTVSVITETTTKSTTISSSPTTVITTVIVTITPTESRYPETSTVTQTTTASPGTDTGAIPPVRPTNSGGSTYTPTTTPGTESYCPTGFYACEARAGSGCCRTGRDCATTSCPPAPPLTTITADGGGATVVVPIPPSATATATTAAMDAGDCAAGWFLCPRDAGVIPGCCPSGYGCGTESCTLARASATVATPKQLPDDGGAAGGRPGVEVGCLLLCAAVAVAVMAAL